jgi:molecular chaperone DnaK (HSP70)
VKCAGTTDLGGWAFTARIVDWVLRKVGANQIDLQNKQFLKTVWKACEKAKADLSLCDETRFKLKKIIISISKIKLNSWCLALLWKYPENGPTES